MKYTRLPFNGRFKITYTYGDYNPKLNPTSDGKHHGLDMVGLDSKDVYSTCKGKVTFAGWNSQGYGNLVMIKEHNSNRVHYYAHLKNVNVSYGQEVTYTTKIGVMGATGNVTGPHTHYEIRDNGVVINPCDYTGLPNQLGEYNSDAYIREEVEEVKEEVKANNGYPMTHKIGDKVRFSTCYISSTAPNSEAIPVSRMSRDTGVITRIEKGAKNPYLLDNGLCWINDGDIRETIVEEPVIYARNNLVVYSHFFRGANDTNAVDCMKQYGSWQQRYIIDIVKGARNPYKLDNGLYLNNDAIKELK